MSVQIAPTVFRWREPWLMIKSTVFWAGFVELCVVPKFEIWRRIRLGQLATSRHLCTTLSHSFSWWRAIIRREKTQIWHKGKVTRVCRRTAKESSSWGADGACTFHCPRIRPLERSSQFVVPVFPWFLLLQHGQIISWGLCNLFGPSDSVLHDENVGNHPWVVRHQRDSESSAVVEWVGFAECHSVPERVPVRQIHSREFVKGIPTLRIYRVAFRGRCNVPERWMLPGQRPGRSPEQGPHYTVAVDVETTCFHGDSSQQ